jgi:hypothetical protein
LIYDPNTGQIIDPRQLLNSGTSQRIAPNAAQIAYLKQHPDYAPYFDAKFGAGASAKILGTR